MDPSRHPAAIAGAITRAWGENRWRAYAVGVLAGLVAGGVLAPIATTSLLLGASLAGATPREEIPWAEIVWSATFALTVPLAGAAAFVYWQPRRLRLASQTYLWLAKKAEEHWAEAFGEQPVPRDEQGMRAVLASMAITPETAGERFGLWIALLDLDRARSAAAEIPNVTTHDQYKRAAAVWLADFVRGTTPSLEPIERLANAIAESARRTEASAATALDHARVALAEGRDWRPPLANVRDQLGQGPDRLYGRLLWRPMFLRLFGATSLAVIVFWAALLVLGPPAW